MSKKIYTRDEFDVVRSQWADQLYEDKSIREKSLNLFIEADKHNWIHQTNWLGEPSLQTPEDLITFQEIIFKTKPDFLIECGVAWAGTLLFYATIMECIDHGSVIGIDIFMPDDLKERIKKSKLSHRVQLLNMSSIEQKTVDLVSEMVGNSKKVMVHLDSNHTHEHVLKELNLYEKFVGKGFYLVAGDTIVDYIPTQSHRPREWGPGNNPKTALDSFMKTNGRFVIDKTYDKKRLMTNQPGGYLIAQS